MSKSNKKFICVFDPSHSVDSQEKLAKHMQKCKSMEKDSYQLCKFNPIHWVKHYNLEDHELNCPDRNKETKPAETSFSKILPSDISRFELNEPFQIDMSMVKSSSSQNSKNSNKKQYNSFKIREDDPNMMGRQQKQGGFKKNKKIQLWVQPDIQNFLKQKGYKKGKGEVNYYRNHPQNFLANNDSMFI